MAQSTFSGPVRSGNVKNTTGTTPGTVANVGLASLSQTMPVVTSQFSANTGSVFIGMLPANSQITNIVIDTIQAFTFTGGTTPTMTVTAGKSAADTTFISSAQTVTALGRVHDIGNFAAWANVSIAASTPNVDVPVYLNWAATGAPSAITAGALNVTVEYTQVQNPNTYT